jgi:hypothetical protein
MKASISNTMVKTVNLGGSESVLEKVDAKAVDGQHIKDLVEANEVFCMSFAENKDVIQVNKNEGVVTEKGIHEVPEHLGCIF